MTHEIQAPPRQIGFWTCLALVIGNTIGTGIFLLPATLAPFGWNAMYGWGITIGGGLCLAYVFAGLARLIPDAGGPYDFIATPFGPFAGFFVMWSYWISQWVTNAALAIGLVSYLAAFAPEFFARPAAGPLVAIAGDRRDDGDRTSRRTRLRLGADCDHGAQDPAFDRRYPRGARRPRQQRQLRRLDGECCRDSTGWTSNRRLRRARFVGNARLRIRHGSGGPGD